MGDSGRLRSWSYRALVQQQIDGSSVSRRPDGWNCERRNNSFIDSATAAPLPRPAGPDALEVRGQGGTHFNDGREAPAGIGVDSGEQNRLELRIDLGIRLDTPADVVAPAPFRASEHRVEHGAQGEQIRWRIGRLTDTSGAEYPEVVGGL